MNRPELPDGHEVGPIETGRLAWIEGELQELASSDLMRELPCRESPPVSGLIQINGHQYINFSSNDYLGIASHAHLVDAIKHVVGQVGWGAGSSPLVTGRGVWHARLERELAKWKNTEAALLFPSGFAANIGALTAIAGPGDLIFSDAENHASIIDGCRLSNAQTNIYDHCDPRSLAELLEAQGKSCQGRKLIVTDSIFSMNGDRAPLKAIARLARRYGAMLMVDEAHATGIFGERGSGLCELTGIEQQVDIRIGTLSKALGSVGGFVAGSQSLIQWLANKSRSYMFSTAVPEVMAAATLGALELVQREPQRRTRLIELAEQVRDSLVESGWDCGNSSTQIVPVVVGSEKRALDLSQMLREQGMLVPAIRPPAVKSGECILRISLSSAHSDDQIQALIEAMQQAGDQVRGGASC